MGDLRDLQISLRTRHKMMVERAESLRKEIEDMQTESVVLDSTAKVIQELVSRISAGELEELNKLITWGLQTVFNEPFTFQVDVKTKREVKYFELSLFKGSNQTSIKSNGGGVQTVISLLLRLYAVSQLKCPKVLFLDEYFPNLDADRIPTFVEMVTTLCKEHNFDILCVSHHLESVNAAADTRYHLVSGDKLKKMKTT